MLAGMRNRGQNLAGSWSNEFSGTNGTHHDRGPWVAGIVGEHRDEHYRRAGRAGRADRVIEMWDADVAGTRNLDDVAETKSATRASPKSRKRSTRLAGSAVGARRQVSPCRRGGMRHPSAGASR